MEHCRDEAHEDDHHHHHHDHNHDDDIEAALKDTLFSKIDVDRVRCLNESEPGASRRVFKPWHERLDTTKFVESDCDEQLIIYVPFTGSVKLKSISIRGGPGAKSPAKMKVIINREDVDFDNADSMTPTQEWELVQAEAHKDVVEYATRITKFTNVRSVTLYFPENYGEDTTVLTYIGFKGDWTEINEDPIITIYELAANPADHKTPSSEQQVNQHIG
ncbi:hypothetical protein K7432_000145 [Basidiobolus ranarum]|uniref:PITH domain-containing protein n=1 Tax=Basidiobolus ranarum TaxID=34480 RepID=A0ABR2WBN5_9FUNG